MAHDHSHHHHHHVPQDFSRAFAIGIALNVTFIVVEVACGLIGDSLALLADAGHNLSDVLGLILAWGAAYLAKRPPTDRRTYGWRRSSILAALFNGMFLLVAVGGIAWEAVSRFGHPEPVAGNIVMLTAAVGVVINGITAWLFMSGGQHDINIRGAYLHMAADAAVSLGVVIAGIVIRLTGWTWIDPATSLVIAAVITYGTWELLWQSIDLSLDAVPPGIDLAAVRSFLAEQPEVSDVHDLHIWAMSTTETALTAHLVRPDGRLDDDWLAHLTHELHHRFAIAHATLQVEQGLGCRSCSLVPPP